MTCSSVWPTSTGVVFDKTGTLTERYAEVSSVITGPVVPEQELLALSAAVEADSDHPDRHGDQSRDPDRSSGQPVSVPFPGWA